MHGSAFLLPFARFSITGEHPVLIISSYNPDAGRTSGNISDFMEEFQRLGGTNTIALENMNCKSFPNPLFGRGEWLSCWLNIKVIKVRR